jgi:meso-butanediol dehydrogenase/(S,S)-butanediol dehydrogenase/diacetyl reductase
MRFDGKVLLGTGAGSGMGAAVARRFASEGGRVALLDVNEDGLAEVGSDIADSLTLPVDISDEAAVEDAVRRTVERFGRIDALYNGAGILVAGTAMDSPVDDLRRHLAVNTVGTYLMCRAVGRQMLIQQSGAIVNTSSVVADVARANRSLYAASKGAIPSLSRHLALELAPHIRVNWVSPGPTFTGMTREHYLAVAPTEAGALAKVGEQVMLKRVATPEELAAPICFLLSDDASYVTGTVLAVDGGMTAE